LKRPPSFKDFQIKYKKLLGKIDWVHLVSPKTKLCAASFSISAGSFDEVSTQENYELKNFLHLNPGIKRRLLNNPKSKKEISQDSSDNKKSHRQEDGQPLEKYP